MSGQEMRKRRQKSDSVYGQKDVSNQEQVKGSKYGEHLP